MKPSIPIALICFFLGSTSNVHAQDAVSVQFEDITIETSNVRVMTMTEQTWSQSGGRILESAVPLVGDKLLPPGMMFFVVFDYKSSLLPSEKPTAIKSIYAGLATGNGFSGYSPCELDKSTGTGVITIANVLSNEEKIVDFETSLKIYGRRKNGGMVSSVSVPEKIKVKCKMDRYAKLSETQFDALKALYGRVVQLEARIKELEARLPN